MVAGRLASTGGPLSVVRVGLLGCGTVGGALLEIVRSDGPGIAARAGVELEVTRVAVRDLAKPRSLPIDADRVTDDAASIVVDPEIDVVVELIGGIEPARSLVLGALRAGKSVVTANKQLLATSGPELFEAAEKAGRDLLYEAAVGGAIPLVRALSVSLRGEPIQRVMGIVNGTTNYILSKMSEEGSSYSEALAEAERLGFAEADPTADVGGYDASQKAAILASIAFSADVVAGDVYREGIEAVEAADIDFAHRLGYEVKLLAVVEQTSEDGAPLEIGVRVHPTMVPSDHPLAGVRGSFNAVFVEGRHAGELMLYGRGAGGQPTASAVLGDLIDAAGRLGAAEPRTGGARHHVAIRPIDELRTEYYLTLDVQDRPGVLAAVATVFGEHAVSIRSMEQVGLGEGARLVFITHLAREADVQATLEDLRHLPAVSRIGGLLRLIGPEPARG